MRGEILGSGYPTEIPPVETATASPEGSLLDINEPTQSPSVPEALVVNASAAEIIPALPVSATVDLENPKLVPDILTTLPKDSDEVVALEEAVHSMMEQSANLQ